MSNANTSAFMPVVEQSLTATTVVGINGGPTAGQEVVFDTQDGAYIQPTSGSWPVTTTTNSGGQARVVVKGTGSGGGSTVTVTAKWMKNGAVHLLTTVELVMQESSGSEDVSPHDSEFPPFQNVCYIPVSYRNTTTHIGSSIGWGFDKWDDTNRVFFSSVSSGGDIVIDEYCDSSDGRYAVTYPVVAPLINYIRIRYNNSACGSDMAACGPNNFCPISWRHHMNWVAAHEVGHAIWFGHNGNTAALMYASIASYFRHKIEAPTAYEVSNNADFKSAYPPCN